MPRVSVIIPTYNREKFILLAIDSVLNQTFKDYEIIVVDDGSTDETKNILKHYDSKINYIYQDNSGVSAARNAGIRIAKGDWLAFLDSDDEWLPEYLSYQMEQVRNNPGICASITNSLQILQNGKVLNTFQKLKVIKYFEGVPNIKIDKPLAFVIKHHVTSLQSFFVKRDELYNAGPFDETLNIAEDFDLIGRIALRGSFVISNFVLVHIIRREESIENLTDQLTNKAIYSRKCFGKVYEKFSSNKTLTKKEKRALNYAYSSNMRALANLLLKKGAIIEARALFRQALFLNKSLKSFFKYLVSLLPRQIAQRFILKRQNVNPTDY